MIRKIAATAGIGALLTGVPIILALSGAIADSFHNRDKARQIANDQRYTQQVRSAARDYANKMDEIISSGNVWNPFYPLPEKQYSFE